MVSQQEIHEALKTIRNSKALGADGFSAKFFKASWKIIGDDISGAIRDFFRSGKLLKSVNIMIITLVPKKKNARYTAEYRPIFDVAVWYTK